MEDLKASVVKIVSKAPEGQPRTGAGFIVRVDGELVHIATAAHVITGDPKPQVTFYFDKLRPVASEPRELEIDNPTAGLGYVIVRDRAVAKQARALGWSPVMPRGGEQILAIGFNQGAGEWGVSNGTVASVSGSDIRIDAKVDEGNSGGPIIMNGSVVGMVTSLRQGFGLAKSGIVVQSTLRGWDIEISAPPTGPAGGGSSTASLRKYASLVGDWLGSDTCTLTFRLDNGRNVEGSCNTAAVRHEFSGVYDTDDRVRIMITRIDPDQCKTTVAGYIRVENDDTIEASQDGWDGCNVKTGPARTRLQRSAR
ncbi:MAG: serine protease [Vicinamibacterales bacterium]